MKKISVILLGFVLLLLGGCGNSNSFQVKLSAPKTFTPEKPYAMQITVTDSDGRAVKGANVSAELNMKNMDHGTTAASVEEIGDGKYIATTNLSMGGDWLIDINVKQGGKSYEDELPFAVDVRTKENAHKVAKELTLPNFKLIDENGRTITKQDLQGKTVVMTFTYVNCIDPNACPILLGNLSNLQDDLKSNGVNTNQIELVSVSVDPENDTPEVLKKHAEEMHFDMSYLKMLTGDLSEVKKLADTLGEHFQKQGSEVIHDNKTFIFDANGKLTHEFPGSNLDREELYQVVTKQAGAL